jgi:hypothetical protein
MILWLRLQGRAEESSRSPGLRHAGPAPPFDALVVIWHSFGQATGRDSGTDPTTDPPKAMGGAITLVRNGLRRLKAPGDGKRWTSAVEAKQAQPVPRRLPVRHEGHSASWFLRAA